MIHTIITDFDGTLVDTFKANLLAYQMAFHEVGMTLTEEKYKDCFGYRFECFMAAMKITNEKIANHIRETKKQYYPQYFKYLKINTPLLETDKKFSEHRKQYCYCIYSSKRKLNECFRISEFDK